MGFFKDLFSAPRPCDVCSINAHQWPRDRTGGVAWTIRADGGLNVEFLICPHCVAAIQQSGLEIPTFVMGYLISHGFVDRPPTLAYLQHDGWRRVWMHALESLHIPVSDEVQALDAIKVLEQGIIDGFDDVVEPT